VAELRTGLLADRFAGADLERSTAATVVWLLNLEKGTKSDPIAPEFLEELTGLSRDLDAARTEGSALERIIRPEVIGDHPATVGALLELFGMWVAIEHHLRGPETDGWVSLSTPHPVDHSQLVQLLPAGEKAPGARVGPSEHYRQRDGFSLTDHRFNHREALNEVEYCIYCHQRDKDSCSKGLREKDGSAKRNPLGVTLNGCPLDEKISEMDILKRDGDGLAALVAVMIDNPMCPGTGHRICNDCMKSCIYQKQDPVNVPQIETSVLTEVLDYPFGFEIYSLLTRWNPLNVRRPHALPYNGRKILVVGLGPAGYTLAQHLLNEGFGVVGIDGLKIEPLPESLVGSRTTMPEPIADWRQMYEELDDRIVLGFGGVSEYGITVRWDKNFLKVIYVTLARRRTFLIHGGIRFGGTITLEDAWSMGFDHVAIATGAGKPTIVPMKNNLIRGVRQASDFLMALQLTGAFKPKALANLLVRLPAVVIGGGLTGIDTTTEAMAYYPVQVERILLQSIRLREELGEEAFWSRFNEEEREILNEFISHATAIREEKARAAAAGEPADLISLIRSWGGVSLVYRKSIGDSPAYRLNHEEIIKALEEGIYFIEDLSPVEIASDHYGAAESLLCERQELNDAGKWRGTGEVVTLGARTILVAAGTSPNTIIERENPGAFEYDKWHQFFSPYVAERNVGMPQAVPAG
jgi:NADPH-dependent glutamate synthase beta subunit-like oxidoreductase